MKGVDVLQMLKRAEAPDRDVSNLAQYVVDDGEPYVRPGLDGIVASSEKLLAMNRGLQEPDDRDSPQFKRIWNTHDLVRERIVRDAGSLRRQMMRRLARMRSLKPIHAGYFDDYVRKQFVSNPLSSPLEEINPMHLLENSRRVTLMGPGGIGSEDAITEEAQSVQVGQFGFMDPISGPESARAGIDTRMAWGAKLGSDGRVYQRFYDRRKNRYRWMSPQDMDGLVVGLPE
jgi:DNA-directed RNA polymerase beta subunit